MTHVTYTDTWTDTTHRCLLCRRVQTSGATSCWLGQLLCFCELFPPDTYLLHLQHIKQSSTRLHAHITPVTQHFYHSQSQVIMEQITKNSNKPHNIRVHTYIFSRKSNSQLTVMTSEQFNQSLTHFPLMTVLLILMTSLRYNGVGVCPLAGR